MKAITIAAVVLALSFPAWAGPGGKFGGGGQKKGRPEAAWKQGASGDASTTCPATGEKKHKREHKRTQVQSQQQSAQKPVSEQQSQ